MSSTPTSRPLRARLPDLLAWGAGLLFLGLALRGAFTTGMSWDEIDHRNLGEMALDFYRSLGEERQATTNVMRYYGALHALVGAGFERLFPGLHWVAARHLGSVLFATIGFLYAVRLARLLAGPWAGAVAALLLATLPGWVGHAMFNPVDVPTAGMFAAAFFQLVRLARGLEEARWRTWLVFGVFAGLTLAVRMIGILLVPFAGAVVVGWCLAHLGERARLRAALPRLVGGLALSGVATIVVSFALWPRMLVEPLEGLRDSLARTNQYPWPGQVFFQGQLILATELPRTYLPVFFAITTPLATSLGLAFALVRGATVLWPWRERLPLALALLLPLLFPPVYAALSGAVLYDGVRHFLFLVPPAAALAATGWTGAIGLLGRVRGGALAGTLALLALVAEPCAWTLRHLPLCYVYFHPLAGGLVGASRRYDTDYWALSVRPAAEWIVAHRRELAGDQPLRIVVSSSPHLFRPWLDDPALYQFVPNTEPYHLLFVHSRWQTPGWEFLSPHEVGLRLVPGQVPFWQIYRGRLSPPRR